MTLLNSSEILAANYQSPQICKMRMPTMANLTLQKQEEHLRVAGCKIFLQPGFHMESVNIPKQPIMSNNQ